MTPRIKRLLERADRRKGSFWRRRRWVAEALASTEHLPIPLRKALALESILLRMPVKIAPDELIVGYHPESVPPRDAPPVATLKPDQTRMRLPEELAALTAGMFTSGAKTGHLTPSYPRLLANGFRGILRQVEKQQKIADPDCAAELEAMAVSLRAASSLAVRYARHAASLASRESNAERAQELATIADICVSVATEPPRNLHEALQLLWFAFLLQCIEEGESTAAFALGRFDQYLHPFWKDALRQGGRSRDELLELIASFWVKLNEFSGLQVLNLTIGGSDKYGNDCVNDLSHACLEITDWMRRATPSLSVRWHPRIDREFFRQAVQLALSGCGQPAFYGDPAVVQAMTNAGVSPDDAVDVVPGGCVELGVQGCCYPWVGNFFNLPKCLELALHNGVDPATGQQIGPATGAAEDLENSNALFAAYSEQVDYFLDLMARSENTTDQLEADYNPYPFLSALVDDCIDRGMDITEGGARYNFTEVQAVGIAHVIDSLTNLQRLVYGDGVLSLSELVAALDNDFEGHESLRQRLQNAQPVYGTDADGISDLARRVVHQLYESVECYINPRGGAFRPGLLVWTLYHSWADCVGALPDGRRRGEALVSSIGPRVEAGIDTPTSILLDVTSFDHYRCAGGLTLNLRFDPKQAETDNDLTALTNLMETYFRGGGMQLQLNTVDSSVLLDAQANPSAHRDLIVRVSGFSARFVDLGRRMQDEIIERTALTTRPKTRDCLPPDQRDKTQPRRGDSTTLRWRVTAAMRSSTGRYGVAGTDEGVNVQSSFRMIGGSVRSSV
ncbi:MAG: hypothetical protein AUJ92_01515 [Armatimonadetes bacterium CG2_30_59_28]|nr:hypothetical protein [Armatimonadota bacterium]OIO98363.1 MAG: hypothetical protein AUJ92_01515 [Armatimonadetes bacterium CG2_30_59_28]